MYKTVKKNRLPLLVIVASTTASATGIPLINAGEPNKQPRREQRGILKQSDLMVRVQRFVLFPLIFYIPANHIFITMLTYSACEVSISPEFTSPQYLFHFWTPFEDFTCRDTFY
ncbi:hypothetical protein DSJ_22910 (plasmid) [Pantoea stewartii subsp. stewartii DC283]|uniref:Uncharacterized protein n=1 Tax=Pantoea stewartii subsp. stewartii DC283 TaxID=660596 RepID=A0ABM6KBF6_PANSE|nr:hypothetical protein DSJ_22910 [Pantoea stewartii subsp. stewartii DC283]